MIFRLLSPGLEGGSYLPLDSLREISDSSLDSSFWKDLGHKCLS